MTIIAYKDGVIAADTLAMNGSLNMGFVCKVTRNKAGDLAGSSGDLGWCQAFNQWFEEGEDGPMPTMTYATETSDQGLVVRKGKPGAVWVLYSHKFPPCRIVIHKSAGFAIGSGKAEAMGAMHAGGNAIEAVKAAITLDDSCGGDINVISLSGARRTIKIGR